MGRGLLSCTGISQQAVPCQRPEEPKLSISSVLFCCVTTLVALNDTFLPSQFLWVRSPGLASLDTLCQDLTKL